jgi:hypothetical protein
MKSSSEYGISQYSQYRVDQKQPPIIMRYLNEWMSPILKASLGNWRTQLCRKILTGKAGRPKKPK